MSHFFREEIVENKKTPKKVQQKKTKSKEEFTITNLPENEKQKFNFISTYLKKHKHLEDGLVDELLKIEKLPRTLRNKLTKMKSSTENNEVEEYIVDDKVDNEVDFDKIVGDCIEQGVEKGIKKLNDVEVSLGIENLSICKESNNNELLLKKEKILKAKLGLYNRNIECISFDLYKPVLEDYVEVCKILNKNGNIIFYVKMLLKTEHKKCELLPFLSTIAEARKIYFDQVFFSSEDEKQILNFDAHKTSNEFYESLDEEYKLAYLLRTNYDEAVKYYYDEKNSHVVYCDNILREFIHCSFCKMDLRITSDLIDKIAERDDHLENIVIVLEILKIRKPEILSTKFVILEQNALMLKSLNKKMELMRAYFCCLNWDFKESAKILKDVMNIECHDTIKETYCIFDQ